MKDIAMHILDIARNSIEADATKLSISMTVDQNKILTITFKDDGRGMSHEVVKKVTDPFFTTRTTRKVGLGIPFLKMNAELTGGSLSIESELKKGTLLIVSFNLNHIDCMPYGDLGSVFSQLLGGNPNKKFLFFFSTSNDNFTINSDEFWTMAHEDNISQPKMILLMRQLIDDNLQEIGIC
jgi:hypothetical protein